MSNFNIGELITCWSTHPCLPQPLCGLISLTFSLYPPTLLYLSTLLAVTAVNCSSLKTFWLINSALAEVLGSTDLGLMESNARPVTFSAHQYDLRGQS